MYVLTFTFRLVLLHFPLFFLGSSCVFYNFVWSCLHFCIVFPDWMVLRELCAITTCVFWCWARPKIGSHTKLQNANLQNILQFTGLWRRHGQQKCASTSVSKSCQKTAICVSCFPLFLDIAKIVWIKRFFWWTRQEHFLPSNTLVFALFCVLCISAPKKTGICNFTFLHCSCKRRENTIVIYSIAFLWNIRKTGLLSEGQETKMQGFQNAPPFATLKQHASEGWTAPLACSWSCLMLNLLQEDLGRNTWVVSPAFFCWLLALALAPCVLSPLLWRAPLDVGRGRWIFSPW